MTMPIADRWRQAGLKACATGVIVASALAAPAGADRRAAPSATAPTAPVAVTALRTEYQTNPLGLDVKAPAYGRQSELLEGAVVFVLASPSGRARSFWTIEPWRAAASFVMERRLLRERAA